MAELTIIPVHTQEYCYSPLDEMLGHHRVTPQQYVGGNHLYT